MTSLKLVKKRRQQLHARDVRGLAAFFLEEKKSQKSCFPPIFKVQTVFTPISSPDKHVKLLNLYLKPVVKKLKF